MEHEEVSMMKNPSRWPAWPRLPVKKRQPGGGWPACGIMIDSGSFDTPEVKPIIYDHNIWDEEPLDRAKVAAQYDTLEAAVADGWVVD